MSAPTILILAQEYYAPENSGFRSRMAQVVRAAAATGADLHVWTFGHPKSTLASDPSTLPGETHVVLGSSSRLANAARVSRSLILGRPFHLARFAGASQAADIAGRVARFAPDLILLESLFLARCVPRPLYERTIYDALNVEHLRIDSILARSPLPSRLRARQVAAVRDLEGQVCATSLATLAVSPEDRARLPGADPARTHLVPNGVDCDRYRDVWERPGIPHRAVFLGNMDYRPNADAVEIILGELAPVAPSVEWHILGPGGSKRLRRQAQATASVRWHGWVPDTLPHIVDASMFVAPLFSGGGTKLKILEAMAAGRAIITTPVGAEGLGLRPGVDAIICQGAQEIATSIRQLHSRPSTARALGTSARQRAVTAFHSDRIRADLTEVLKSYLPSPGPGRRFPQPIPAAPEAS